MAVEFAWSYAIPVNIGWGSYHGYAAGCDAPADLMQEVGVIFLSKDFPCFYENLLILLLSPGLRPQNCFGSLHRAYTQSLEV